MQKMSIRDKVAQMLIVGLGSKGLDEKNSKMIVKDKVGGIILYRKNYNNYEQMLELINAIKEKNQKNPIPIFISIDQEGGRVNRLPQEFLNFKSAKSIATMQNKEILREEGRVLGEILRKSGIQMNYGPVFDIQRFPDNHAIGDRCYGTSKEEVAEYAVEVMKGLQEQEILSVIKHFPGHGAVTEDSHFRIPHIKFSKKQLEEEIIPFEKAIQQRVDAIMIGHLIIEGIDKHPATLSNKIIKKYLLEKNNFEGLILTDDLKMLSIKLHYSLENAIERAIKAGNHMIMVGESTKRVEKAIDTIAKRVEKGKIPIELIDNSVQKIIQMKERYRVTDEPAIGVDRKEINERINQINKKILEAIDFHRN